MNRTLTASALVALAALMAAPAFAAAAPATTTTKPAMAAMAPAKPVAAPAKPAVAKPVVLTFAKIDANHDGKISFDELKKYFPTVTKAEFDKYDADKSGDYNKAELAAFVKGQKPAKAPAAPVKAPVKAPAAAAAPVKAPAKK